MKKKRGRPKSITDKISKEYLNVSQLSKLLKISVSHIYTMTSRKKIPHIKVLGKKIIFEKSEIKEWLNSKKVMTN